MKTYPSGHWSALGGWIASARIQAGYSDTKTWAAAVGRSTRQVLGLERGEPVGPKTIEAVADALEVGSSALFGVLDSGEVRQSWSEAKAAAAADQRAADLDRQAIEKPEESSYWTSPEGDDVHEPVTWSHMEGRLAEIETRIARIERSILRVLNATRGGDGNADSNKPGGSAPTKVPEAGPDKQPAKPLSVAPDSVEHAAAADDQDQPAAGEQESYNET